MFATNETMVQNKENTNAKTELGLEATFQPPFALASNFQHVRPKLLHSYNPKPVLERPLSKLSHPRLA